MDVSAQTGTPTQYRFVLVDAGANPATATPAVTKTVSPTDVICNLAPSTDTLTGPYTIAGGVRLEFDDPSRPGRRCVVAVAIADKCRTASCAQLEGYLRTENAAGVSAWEKVTPAVVLEKSTVVDCVVSPWSAFSAWTAWVQSGAIDTRTRTQTRTVLTPASNGGAACPALTNTETETRPTSTPVPASPDLTRVPPSKQIVDAQQRTWTLATDQTILRDGVAAFAGWKASTLTWCGGTVRFKALDTKWYRWNGTAPGVEGNGLVDVCMPPVQPPPPVDCVVSEWSSFTYTPWVVSGVLETRTGTRDRTILKPAANGGVECPRLTETIQESRPIPTDSTLCSFPLGAEAVSVTVTRVQMTAQGRPGSKMRADFQLASRTPIVQVAVKMNGITVSQQAGDDLTDGAGQWFTTPASGTYKLSVYAKNAFGCEREAPALSDVVIK